MPLIQILLTLLVVGVLLWLVNLIPMQGTIKSILNSVVVIFVVIWLLNVFGLMRISTGYASAIPTFDRQIPMAFACAQSVYAEIAKSPLAGGVSAACGKPVKTGAHGNTYLYSITSRQTWAHRLITLWKTWAHRRIRHRASIHVGSISAWPRPRFCSCRPSGLVGRLLMGWPRAVSSAPIWLRSKTRATES